MSYGEITVRVATPDDSEKLLAIYGPYVEETAITFEYEVPSVDEFARRIENTLRRYPFLVAESGDEMLGYAYASAFKDRPAYDWSVETSVYVKRGSTGRGVGHKLYGELERALREQGILNVNACIACPKMEDERLTQMSLRFHEAMGFHLVGRFHECGYKFNRWYDMVWMEKLIGDHVDMQPVTRIFQGACPSTPHDF